MSAPLHVVKLGGRSLESAGAIDGLAREAAAFEGRLLFVHGGGAEVSAWSRRFGIEPEFVNGLRVTDPATLEVAVAVLAGLANKRLVAALRHAGVDAAGIAALDGGLLPVMPADPRLGAVGRIVSAEPRLIETLLAASFTPVVASIAAEGGRLMNVNADDVAAALAAALGATSLTLLSDVSGVRLNGRRVEALSAAGLRAALESPDVTGGMIPKLEAALTAISAGVARVHIGAWAGEGTLRGLSEGFPSATTCVAEVSAHHAPAVLSGGAS